MVFMNINIDEFLLLVCEAVFKIVLMLSEDVHLKCSRRHYQKITQ